MPDSIRARRLVPLAALLLAGLLPGCSGDPGTGPIEVKWDRDACQRCNMVLSDRRHSAQVRYTPGGGRSRADTFDDLGCALLWLDQQPWRADPKVEIWVTDHRDGRWIDARKAHYLPGQITPMFYGLGAQSEAAPDTLDFAQAKAHIVAVEARYNVHGAHLKQNAADPHLPAGGTAAAPAERGRHHDETPHE